MTRFLIVTDLDGSLLDHYTYSAAPAMPLLKELHESDVPVVLCSSKTRAEMKQLRRRLGLSTPYIVENGAAVFIPSEGSFKRPKDTESVEGDWCHRFGPGRRHWLNLLETLPSKLDNSWRGFSDLTIHQIADLTGLSKDDAALAAAREFGEPVQWLGTLAEQEQWCAWLEERGAKILRGGRFLHVAGPWDKGMALQWLRDALAAELSDSVAEQEPLVTIALGDSHNDIAMLEAADYAVVIRSPVHPPPPVSGQQRVYVTRATGPLGWVEGIRHWQQQLSF